MRPFTSLLIFLLAAASGAHAAQRPEDLLASYALEVDASETGFAGFDADAGRRFFLESQGDWSCATCHTRNPGATGRHVVTGKTIAPLAPAVNPERFTDSGKVEKWFKRNCKDVIQRPCSAREKGDVLAFLLEVKPR